MANWILTGGPWSARGIFQWPGHSPWEGWGSKPTDYSTSTRRGAQIHLAVKSSQVSVHQREIAGDAERLLKVNTQHFIGSYLPWAQAKTGQGGLEMHEESLVGLVTLGKELKEQPPGFLSWVIPHTAEAILGRAHYPPSGINLKGSNSPACRNYSAPPCID